MSLQFKGILLIEHLFFAKLTLTIVKKLFFLQTQGNHNLQKILHSHCGFYVRMKLVIF